MSYSMRSMRRLQRYFLAFFLAAFFLGEALGLLAAAFAVFLPPKAESQPVAYF